MNVSIKHLLLAIFAIVGFQACGSCHQTLCDPSIPFPEPGSCGIEGAAEGTAGGPCETWLFFSGCDEDLVCNSGVCIPCGKNGSTCCGTEPCKDGSFCAQDPGKANICTNSCGAMAGLDCCPGNQCAANLQCNLNTKQCEPQSANACSGPLLFVFMLRDINGCGTDLTIASTDASNALACASQQAASIEHEVLGPATELPKWYDYCNEGLPDSQLQVRAWSSQDAYQCAHSACLNCNTVPGVCN
jgi:hypothetical protein